jgi:hypothetical protein
MLTIHLHICRIYKYLHVAHTFIVWWLERWEPNNNYFSNAGSSAIVRIALGRSDEMIKKRKLVKMWKAIVLKSFVICILRQV